ncbi:hypothetical protein A6P54_12955 [Bacillus sp. MKU004]|nr:hypothetical protein A6P54_12955 [Bacillus sp. MKU004]
MMCKMVNVKVGLLLLFTFSIWIVAGTAAEANGTVIEEAHTEKVMDVDSLVLSYDKGNADKWQLSINYNAIDQGEVLNVYDSQDNLLGRADESTKEEGFYLIDGLPLLDRMYVSVTNAQGVEGEKVEIRVLESGRNVADETVEVKDGFIIVSGIEYLDNVHLYNKTTGEYIISGFVDEEGSTQYRSELRFLDTDSQELWVVIERNYSSEGIKVLSLSIPKKPGEWFNESGLWYFYKENGSLFKGWLNDKGSWYYLDDAGVMQAGWLKYINDWYYLNSSGAMETGWLKTGEEWYYLNASGVMETGWVKSGNTWYFLNASGAMETGWIKSGSQWYFLNTNGSMQTGWIQTAGKWYFLYRNGAMAASAIVDGYKLGSDGAWIQ